MPKPEQSVPRRSPGDVVPLSFAQEQVWLHAQLAPELPLYNEPVTVHYTGQLDVVAFERAFNEIVRRHEAWRTSFTIVDGSPAQVVQPELRVSIPIVDLRQIPLEKRESEAIRIATMDAAIPLDLTKAPLFRAKLIRLDDERHRLYMTLSHIIFDGVSIYRVFLPELTKLYRAFVAGEPSPLAELPFQVPDYACWQRNNVAVEKQARDLSYWRELLQDGLPTLDLPFDRRRKPVQTFRGSMYPWVLDRDLLNELKSLSQKEGVTLFQTLLASFAVQLQRYSGLDDIPIGTVTSGRDVPGTSQLLGYFLNMLVLRLDLSGNLTFRDLLKRARHTAIEGLAHDSVPFGTLVNELRVERDSSRNPLFQSFFTLEPPIPELDPGWQLTQMDIDTGTTKYDLYLELDERRDGLLARYHYSTDLFDSTTVQRMAKEWTTLLRSAVANPDVKLQDLTLLPAEEQRLLDVEWNATAADYPQSTIHGLFEAQVQRTPDAIALEFGDQRLSYAELNARAERTASYLIEKGVGPDVLVGLKIERSIEMVVGLLGILKAGGAYIPLDPSYPDERLQFIIDDAKPLLVLTDVPTAEPRPLPAVDPGARAYVLYTSGSTGKPKGVEIEHRSVVNFLSSMQKEPGIGREDVLVSVTTMSFDIAGLEIYLPLITGATIVLASSEVARDGARLRDLLKKSGATIMQATPATWRMLIESGWSGPSKLKVLCGGEAMPAELATALAERSASVWNLYGPTETTIWSLLHRVKPPYDGAVPIGRPIANTQVRILDRHGNPSPIGVAGEIYIGGDGLARGYLNRAELTAERFVERPERLYRTGDRGRYLADGTIEFLQRTDTQIKIRGFRVELGDIEANLERCPSVKANVVEVREVAPGDPRLVAYVVPNGVFQPADARDFLRRQLPDYMVPAHFVTMDALPATLNGKVDRKALPAPETSAATHPSAATPPRNEVEAELVRLFETVLGTTSIGVFDDFFALGGHSILAVRLFAAIEKTFGKSIPLATLLKAPTVAQLAEIISSGTKTNQWTSLVPLQPKGTRPPLFCIHGHYGEILFYRQLSNQLGEQQPFYALQAVAAGDGLPAHDTIEDMAAHYLSEMRQVQPNGPYHLAGYCFGSLVAFEIAQRLRREGEEVVFLGLFLGYDSNEPLLARFSKRLLAHAAQLKREGWKAKARDLWQNSTQKLKSVLWRIAYAALRNVLPRSSELFRNVPEMNLQAAKRYVPEFYPGTMTVFLSGELPENFQLRPSVDLHGMNATSIELRRVPGERFTMLQDPFVAVLAQHVRLCLHNSRV